MNVLAAQAQARFAAQPDNQSAQSSAAAHPLHSQRHVPCGDPRRSARASQRAHHAACCSGRRIRSAQRHARSRAEILFSRRSRRLHDRAKHAFRAGRGFRRLLRTAATATRTATQRRHHPSSQLPRLPHPHARPLCPFARPPNLLQPSRPQNTGARANPLLNPPPNPRSPRKLSATPPSGRLKTAPRPKTRRHPPPPPNPKRNPDHLPAPAPPTRISSSKISRHSAAPGFAFSARPLRPARATWPSSSFRPSRADTRAGSAARRC